MSAPSEVVICADLSDAARKGAELFIRIASRSIARRGLFTAALSGGNTPLRLYSLLSSGRFIGAIDWERAHIFWGDERCVRPESDESNFKGAYVAFIRRLNMPPGNIHRIRGERGEAGAEEYEREIKRFFRLSCGEFPRFDFMLLGIGADGHTASLFPGMDAVKEDKRTAVHVMSDKLKTARITLTPPAINNSSNIVLLASGREKASAVKTAIEGAFKPESSPVQITRSASGDVTWLIDRDAAFELASL